MSEGLLARKGEANPATTHHGGESRFQARRIIVLPPIPLQRPADSTSPQEKLPRRAANMAKPAKPPIKRRKFTFRIEPERHAAFCNTAESLGISRQELLTRALDAYLKQMPASDTRQHNHRSQEDPAPQMPL
jgi:hypothetical protein